MSDLIRQLNLSDIISYGFGYTVGADIFALIPYILKIGKNYSWVAFLIGGIIMLATVLSYARLNLEYPSNDAEYTWIKEAFKVKEEDIKTDFDIRRNKCVDIFATVVIWVVIILGITMNAAMVVIINRFLKKVNINIPDIIMNFLIVLIPFGFNLLDAKNMSKANIIVTILTSLILFIIPGFAVKSSPYVSDLKLPPLSKDNLINLVKSVAITIFPYNGYQSVVQMSEEVKDIDNIPKGMIISGILTIILYTILYISVIAILGLTGIQKTTTPISDIYEQFLGSIGSKITIIIGLLSGFTALLLCFHSRSRLISKISECGIAPELFSNLGIKSGNKSLLTGIPFNSIVAITIVTYILTILKSDSLEILIDITNILTFFVFISVNLGVIVNYFKKNNKVDKPDKEKTFLDKFEEMTPYYAILGLLIFSILFISGLKDLF